MEPLIEPWFDAQAYGWVIAVLSGCAGFSTGMLGEKLAPKGKGRRPIFASLYAQEAGSVLLIAAGLAGRTMGQPYAVWSAILIPGVIGLIVVSLTIFRLIRIYRKSAEKAVTVQSGA
jgi:hypothetical protein